MLGNSYPTGGGPLSQNHVQSVNNFTSMGMFNDMNSNDGAPFDINDFPQLNSRPNSSGGPQGQIGNHQSGYYPVQTTPSPSSSADRCIIFLYHCRFITKARP